MDLHQEEVLIEPASPVAERLPTTAAEAWPTLQTLEKRDLGLVASAVSQVFLRHHLERHSRKHYLVASAVHCRCCRVKQSLTRSQKVLPLRALLPLVRAQEEALYLVVLSVR